MVINIEEYEKYFSEIKKEYKRGECTELTHRFAIKEFVEAINSHLELSGENKIIKGIGRPDFICFKKKIKIGYIETKDLFDISSEQGLKKILNSTQLVKYQNEAIPNLILTDYMRFILIRNKEKRFDITLFTKEDLDKGKFEITEELIKQFNQLIESFLDYDLPTIKNSTDLAYELSKKAILLRALIKEQLDEDLEKIKNKEEASPVYEFYEAFKELIKDAKPEDCVDAYAQTITYGLFLSKIGSHDGLNRDSAATYIPSSIKIIKKIFTNIAGDDLPSNCSWIVDEIIDILNAADIPKILSEFVFEGKHYKDPFIHFYEDFLKEYDPEKRKHLGVYYTPEPVVSFITNSINEILKKEFGKQLGFADDSVNVLDFATGTGTFLANSFVLALKEIRKAGLTGEAVSQLFLQFPFQKKK
ncbi:MAG: N-6 DNA methylase [Nanoarchaeota archaeon]|nr:N-6 DNA methylase [Nanoarchaeota archaeon]MBU1597144.1 N-6 DNA methylase [Nanoarchaeota archaeon]